MSIQKGNYNILGTMLISIHFGDLQHLSPSSNERMEEVLNTV